jgi:hypothetical protein
MKIQIAILLSIGFAQLMTEKRRSPLNRRGGRRQNRADFDTNFLGAGVRLVSAILAAMVLAGCAKQYARTDGAAVDTAHERATLAQCKGEGAIAIPTQDAFKQEQVTEACMARNGYILSGRQ